MKNILLFITMFSLFIFSACDKDSESNEHDHQGDFEYHAHIQSPNTENKHQGDTINIDIIFESHSGMIVHNIDIKLYSKNDESEIIYEYQEHGHETSGMYEYR